MNIDVLPGNRKPALTSLYIVQARSNLTFYKVPGLNNCVSGHLQSELGFKFQDNMYPDVSVSKLKCATQSSFVTHYASMWKQDITCFRICAILRK